MPRSIAEILAVVEDPANAGGVTVKIPVVPAALRAEHAALDARLKELRKTRDTVDISPEEIESAQRVREIEDQMEAAMQEFHFLCIGHRAWRDLLRKHPPTKAQLDANKQINADHVLDYNVDTFPQEAMAASCADPEMTPDDVRRLESSPWMTGATWMTLWVACTQANMANAVPKSMAAGLILHRNDKSAAIAANGESPEASSSDA